MIPESRSQARCNCPLKLALLTRRYPPLIGGAEKVFSYLAMALASEGADVSVITSQLPGSEVSDREEFLFDKSETSEASSASQPGRLSVVRLATARLRFWGTWRYMKNLVRWFERQPG